LNRILFFLKKQGYLEIALVLFPSAILCLILIPRFISLPEYVPPTVARMGKWEMFNRPYQRTCQVRIFQIQAGAEVTYPVYKIFNKNSRRELSSFDFLIKNPRAIEGFRSRACKSVPSNMLRENLKLDILCDIDDQWVEFERTSLCD
jgi:hypothetical protein